MKNRNWGYLLWALIISFIVTAVMIFTLSFIMYKFEVSEKVIGLGVTFIYILSCAIGGFYIGRTMKVKKFLWGFLVGLIYMLVLTLVSVLFNKSGYILAQDGLSIFFLCVGGGTLGGMLS